MLPLSSVASIRVRGVKFEFGGIGTLIILPGPCLDRDRFINVGIHEAVMNREEPRVCPRLSWRYDPNLEYALLLVSETNIGLGPRRIVEAIICVRGFGQTNCLGPHICGWCGGRDMDHRWTRGWGLLCSIDGLYHHRSCLRTPPSRLRTGGTPPIPGHVLLTSYNVA